MKTFNRNRQIPAALALCMGVLVAMQSGALSQAKQLPQTKGNLEKAYVGETTACSKYQAYAQKARAEGKKGVASLFEAASQAEAIHASNHASVLATLGETSPKSGAFSGKVGSTQENLKDAWRGETSGHSVPSVLHWLPSASTQPSTLRQ